jgi:hypothetical protein
MADDDLEKHTEIDSADDLFDEISSAPSTAPMDEDEVSFGEPDQESALEKKSEPTFLSDYLIPAIGAMLILSLGWTCAFIVRGGLSPLPPTQVVAKGVKPQTNGSTSKSTDGPTKDSTKEVAKQAPRKDLSSILRGPKRNNIETRDVTVRIEHPFFIPLEGDTEKVKNGGKPKTTVFLNLTMNLLVSNKEAATEFKAKRVQIRNEVFSHYNRLSPKDLESAENRERIRRELIEKIDKKLLRGEVKGILFQEFFTR